MYPIITISREVGSEGHAVGEMVAKELGIPLLDKAFVAEVAGRMGFDEEKILNKGEYLYPFEKYMDTKTYMGHIISDDQDAIFRVQREIILEEAKKGPCVIVGRCADVILEEEGIPALNVFIHADMEHRIAVYKKRYPEIRQDMEKLLTKKDKGRRDYYRFYTAHEWGRMTNYDICLNSGALGVEMCASIVAHAAKEHQ